MDLFAKKNPMKVQRSQEIKSRVHELMVLNEDATVMVTELTCQDEDCPEVETVIALFRPGLPEFKSTLHSSIEEVTDGEIEEFCRKAQQSSKPDTQVNSEDEIELPL